MFRPRASCGAFAFATLLLVLGMVQPAVPAPQVDASQVVPGHELSAMSLAAAQHTVHDQHYGLLSSFDIADQVIPKGKVTLQSGTPITMGSGFIEIPITISVDSHMIRTVYATYHLLPYTEAPVAVADFPAGHILALNDLVFKRILNPNSTVASMDALIGRKLDTALAQGQIPTLAQTSANPIVHAGDPVVLIIHDGNVALAADVVARTSGALGETVIVYEADEQRTLSGVVTAPSRVELTLPEVNNS